MKYEFTIDDPTTFTKKWTVAIPMARTDEQIYEYACHEGNYGMVNLLKGARVQEKAGGEIEMGSGFRFLFAVRGSWFWVHSIAGSGVRSADLQRRRQQTRQGAKPVARPNFDGIWNSATTTPLERPRS